MAPTSRTTSSVGAIAASVQEKLRFITPGGVVYLTPREWNYMQENTTRDPLLVEREKTHGSFASNAEVWQTLCTIFNKVQFQNDSQRLAANMIFLKIARMAQTPQVKDHWDDIAGYAKLGAEACE